MLQNVPMTVVLYENFYMYAKNDTSDVIKLPNNVLMVGGNVRLYFWKPKLCSVSSFGGSVYYRSR